MLLALAFAIAFAGTGAAAPATETPTNFPEPGTVLVGNPRGETSTYVAVADVYLRKLENGGALVVLFEDGREIEFSRFTPYRFAPAPAATAEVAD